jgi:predicted nucleotidyltransferase
MGQEMHEWYDSVLGALRTACEAHYGARLVALALFGSVARGTPRPDSDIDVLLIADPLPDGRLPRVHEFEGVEAAIEPALAAARRHGLAPTLSAVIKTPAEVSRGSPLFLDMVEDARILYDRDGFLSHTLADLRSRLDRLGARRVWRGDAWYWDLKPDYTPGEVFEI